MRGVFLGVGLAWLLPLNRLPGTVPFSGAHHWGPASRPPIAFSSWFVYPPGTCSSSTPAQQQQQQQQHRSATAALHVSLTCHRSLRGFYPLLLIRAAPISGRLPLPAHHFSCYHNQHIRATASSRASSTRRRTPRARQQNTPQASEPPSTRRRPHAGFRGSCVPALRLRALPPPERQDGRGTREGGGLGHPLGAVRNTTAAGGWRLT